jgi:heme-degrading monooxygenase HmoA
MIAVILELVSHAQPHADYLEAAAQLRPRLEAMDGFISVERFESLSRPGKVLSLSFWRDEEAVRAWRGCEPHRALQAQGRVHIFENYRLRVAAVVRDHGLNERAKAPAASRAWHG